MKTIIFLCAMLLSCISAFSQNSLSGIITDQDGNPLPGTTIYIPDMNKGTVSDKNGKYHLNNLPKGKLLVRFTYIGYINCIETVEMNGVPQTLNISLKQTAIEAEEVVISGGYNSTQHENAVKIDVLKIDPEELKSSPNFMEMITKIPGVGMISKGSGVSKPVIRGMSMNDILVLNNGVRLENYQYSSHHPLGIDESDIETVEVIKGPASLLYGSDAIGGVINFIREKSAPVGTVRGDFNTGLFTGSQGYSTNLGIKGTGKKFYGGVRFGIKNNADYLQGGGLFVPNTRFNEQSLKANSGFTSKTGTFNLLYEFHQQNLGLAEDEAIEQIPERGRKTEIFYQQLNTHLLSSQNKLYLKKYRLDLNASYQNTELTHFGNAGEYELQMALATIGYEARLHFPSAGKSELFAGIQGFSQTNTNLNNRETILLPDATSNNYSGFVLLQRPIGHKIKFQTGLRYDERLMKTTAVGNVDSAGYRAALDKSYGSFSGSIGGTYTVSEKILFRINIASAYRTPNLAELTSNGPHELRYEKGDGSLIPEKSTEGDLSIHLHQRHFTIDVAVFCNAVDHFIYIAPTGDTTISGMNIFQYRQANSMLYGGEAGFHLHPEIAEWLHFETTFAHVTGIQRNGEYLPFIPASSLHAEIRAEKDKLWILQESFIGISTETAFNQNNPAPDETSTSGYTLLNFSIGTKITKGRQPVFIGFSITNLLDEKYIDHLSTLKEVGYFNPGRNFILTMKIPFGCSLAKESGK